MLDGRHLVAEEAEGLLRLRHGETAPRREVGDRRQAAGPQVAPRTRPGLVIGALRRRRHPLVDEGVRVLVPVAQRRHPRAPRTSSGRPSGNPSPRPNPTEERRESLCASVVPAPSSSRTKSVNRSSRTASSSRLRYMNALAWWTRFAVTCRTSRRSRPRRSARSGGGGEDAGCGRRRRPPRPRRPAAVGQAQPDRPLGHRVLLRLHRDEARHDRGRVRQGRPDEPLVRQPEPADGFGCSAGSCDRRPGAERVARVLLAVDHLGEGHGGLRGVPVDT